MEVDPNLGYAALGALVAAESTGVPVPGETALLAAAVLAGRGELDIELVIAVAATAAIVGDNVGYMGDKRRPARLPARTGGGRGLQGRRDRGSEPDGARARGVRDRPLAVDVASA